MVVGSEPHARQGVHREHGRPHGYRLPVDTQEALQRLACLEHSAAITTLALVHEEAEEEVHAHLSQAVHNALIERLEGAYRFIHDRAPMPLGAAVIPRLGSRYAYADPRRSPPFDIVKDGIATAFDIELMRAVCGRLSLELRALAYAGENFNDIFEDTSDIVARHLLAHGDIASIRYCAYHGIGTALDDLEAGRIGLVIKLFPVISWLNASDPNSRS